MSQDSIDQLSDAGEVAEKIREKLRSRFSEVAFERLGVAPDVPHFDETKVRVEHATENTDHYTFQQGIRVTAGSINTPFVFDSQQSTTSKNNADIETDLDDSGGAEEDSAIAPPEMLTISKDEFDQHMKAAHDQGVTDTLTEIEKNRAISIEELERSITSIIEDLQAQIHEHLENVEGSFLELALTLTEKLIFARFDEDIETIQRVIQEALKVVSQGLVLQIGANSETVHTINNEAPSFLQALEEKGITLVPDNGVIQGCILYTEQEHFNFDVSATFDRIRKEVLGEES